MRKSTHSPSGKTMRAPKRIGTTTALKAAMILVILLILLASDMPVALAQSPDKAWKTNNTVKTVGDCTGTANQTNNATHSDSGTGQLCQNYDTPTSGQTDVYESLDSTVADLSGVDIKNMNLACDSNFLYLEWETVTAPDLTASHDFLATIDIDPDTEAGPREDYYFEFAAGINWLAGPNSNPDWVDGNASGTPSNNSRCDADDDVGGSNPLRSDAGSPSDNFNDCVIEEVNGKVYVRSTSYTGSGSSKSNTGFMQMAINLDVGEDTDGNTLDNISCSDLRVRIWSSQTSTFSADKIPWHDGQTVSDLSSWDHDNTLWFGGTTAITLSSFAARSSAGGSSVVIPVAVVGLLGIGALGTFALARHRMV